MLCSSVTTGMSENPSCPTIGTDCIMFPKKRTRSRPDTVTGFPLMVTRVLPPFGRFASAVVVSPIQVKSATPTPPDCRRSAAMVFPLLSVPLLFAHALANFANSTGTVSGNTASTDASADATSGAECTLTPSPQTRIRCPEASVVDPPLHNAASKGGRVEDDFDCPHPCHPVLNPERASAGLQHFN